MARAALRRVSGVAGTTEGSTLGTTLTGGQGERGREGDVIWGEGMNGKVYQLVAEIISS